MQVWKDTARAFRVGCPILSIQTSDPAHTIIGVTKELQLLPEPVAVLIWDCVRGITYPVGHKVGQEALSTIDGPDELVNPVSAIDALEKLPPRTVLVMLNIHQFLQEVTVKQAIWNIRDTVKATRKMLILTGPTIILPPELQHDVIALNEPLPDAVALHKVVSEVVESAGLKVEEVTITDAANAALGVTAFAAENLASFAVTKNGLDTDKVWASKKAKINQTPGLSVVDTGNLDDIGGIKQIKKFLSGVLKGNDPPNAIVFVDEIEKSIGGSSHDTSGVSQDQLGQLLGWMQDKQASGCILVGPPGCSKSMLAKAAGQSTGIPTIQLDLGGAKGSLVGESEAKIRDALKVIDAVSGGKTLWIATCNSLTSLPPELRRRYRLGVWYCDLPDAEERSAIWAIYAKKFNRTKEEYDGLINFELTGAEIESICDIAHRIGCSLVEANDYITPVYKAASEMIASLRAGAEGKLLDASNPGTYQRVRKTPQDAVRKFE